MRDKDMFNLDFFKNDKDEKSENNIKIRQELAGINNICYSLSFPNDFRVEVDAVHIYATDLGYYDLHLDFLTKAFFILGIDFEMHKIDGVDTLPYGDLPLLRIENMFFTKEYFLQVVMKLITNDEDEVEDLANMQILNLFEEFGRVIKYYMFVNHDVQHRYRNRYWTLFSPLKKLHATWKNQKIANQLSEEGLSHPIYAIENAKKLLEKLNRIFLRYGGFFIGRKEKNVKYLKIEFIKNFRAMIIETFSSCTIQAVIKNIVETNLYDLVKSNFTNLITFSEAFDANLKTYLADNVQEKRVKIQVKKQEFNHKYESLYKSAEQKRNEFNNSIFFGITSISLLLYVFVSFKG